MKLFHELLDFVRHDTKSAITMIRWIVVGIGLVAIISAIDLFKPMVSG